MKQVKYDKEKLEKMPIEKLKLFTRDSTVHGLGCVELSCSDDNCPFNTGYCEYDGEHMDIVEAEIKRRKQMAEKIKMRVKTGITVGSHGHAYFNDKMKKLEGTIIEVKKLNIAHHGYNYTSESYKWLTEWLEPVKIKYIPKFGDKVIINGDRTEYYLGHAKQGGIYTCKWRNGGMANEKINWHDRKYRFFNEPDEIKLTVNGKEVIISEETLKAIKEAL